MSAVMTDDDYLRLAAYAEREADRTTDPRVRARWLRKATQWLRQLGRPPAQQQRSRTPEPAADGDETRERPRDDGTNSWRQRRRCLPSSRASLGPGGSSPLKAKSTLRAASCLLGALGPAAYIRPTGAWTS